MPSGSGVVVCAEDILDDDEFFGMVAENISRKITYQYLMPRDGKYQFDNLLDKLKFSGVDAEIESATPLVQACFSKIVLPFNYVVHLTQTGSDGEMEIDSAFSGIVQSVRPEAYYRVTRSRAEKFLKNFDTILNSKSPEVDYSGKTWNRMRHPALAN